MARLALSQNERLLLHLLELDRHRDDAEVPMAVSQEGIAQGLDTQVHTASRALSSLQEEGLVFDRLAHVRGAPKRRRAYFLTDKGRLAAQALRADLMKRLVVVEHAGKSQELPLEDAVRKLTSLTGACPSLVSVLDTARTSDTIRSDAFAKPCAPEKVEYVQRSHGRPSVGSFFGRDREKETVLSSLSGDVGAVLIWGMPGIGKSTFASKIFEELTGKRFLFWYSFRDWDTESSFMSALAEFLASSGRSSTASALRSGTSPVELYGPLLNDLAGHEFVLFLDDVTKPVRPVSSLLEVLVEAVKSSGSGRVVLLSRSVPVFFSNAARGNMALELQGLDRDSAWRMAQSLSAKDASRVVTESHGHPLLLTLMARGSAAEASGDAIAFIEREVYSTVSEQERSALELLSVFRHPVAVDALQDLDYESVASLRNRALVVEQQDGVWAHDLLREFFASRVSQPRKVVLHRQAAAYCESHAGVEWRLETLFHNVEAGDWNASRRVAMSNAHELAKEFKEETLALVSRIPKDLGTARERAELLFLRGQLEDSMDQQEQALADFEESLSLLSVESDSDKRAIVLETAAKLQAQVQKWSESLAAHEKALSIYEQSSDKEGQTREWINIGGVHRRRGDIKRAREAFDNALSLASMAEDRPAQAACLNNLALLEWDEGRISEAEARLRESIRLAHTVRDHAGEAKGLENLSELLRAQLRLPEAVVLLLESSEAFRRAGEPVESKRVQAVCASVLGDEGKFSEAMEICKRALVRPDLRRRKGLFQKSKGYDSGDAAVSATLVDLLRQSGDLKGSHRELTRYMEMASSMGDSSLTARGKLMQALLNEGAGDLESAVKALDEAESLLRSVGNRDGLIAVHMRRGVVEEKRGDDPAAARHYEEAARQAELAGNRHARALALENMESLNRGV